MICYFFYFFVFGSWTEGESVSSKVQRSFNNFIKAININFTLFYFQNLLALIVYRSYRSACIFAHGSSMSSYFNLSDDDSMWEEFTTKFMKITVRNYLSVRVGLDKIWDGFVDELYEMKEKCVWCF